MFHILMILFLKNNRTLNRLCARHSPDKRFSLKFHALLTFDVGEKLLIWEKCRK